MQGGIGPRIVEPIIKAAIGITAALEDLQSDELTLESNLPVQGRRFYGVLDHLIKAKQVRAISPSPSNLANREAACILQYEVSDKSLLPHGMQRCAQGVVVVKVAETQQALTSASEDHQRGQMLVQMA